MVPVAVCRAKPLIFLQVGPHNPSPLSTGEERYSNTITLLLCLLRSLRDGKKCDSNSRLLGLLPIAFRTLFSILALATQAFVPPNV